MNQPVDNRGAPDPTANASTRDRPAARANMPLSGRQPRAQRFADRKSKGWIRLSRLAGNLDRMSGSGDGNDLKSPEHMVGVMMNYILRRMQAEADGDLLPHGMKTRHAVVLTLLRDLGEQPQSELPQALGIDATGVVALLNGLEEEGLIERRRSPEDRRKHNVLITRAGLRRLADIEKVAAELEVRLLGLEPSELATLHTLLAKATANLADGPHLSNPAPIVTAK